MKIAYIKQFEKEEELLNLRQQQYTKFIRKIIAKIKKMFLTPNITELEDSIIVILPTSENEKISENKIEKIIKKIRKRAYIQNVAVSNFLLKNFNIKNYIEENNMHILDGTWLWNHMVLNLIKYVCNKKEDQLQKQEVAILVKENTEINMQNIIEIAKNVKFVNVFTPYKGKFKMIEEYLYSIYGVVIRITNNKKAIVKSNIIVNIDFSEEELNQYTISERAIVLNKNKHVNIGAKKFTGINCNSFKINWNEKNINELKERNIYNYFNKNILYESAIYRKDTYKNICADIEKDEVKIVRTYWNKRAYR